MMTRREIAIAADASELVASIYTTYRRLVSCALMICIAAFGVGACHFGKRELEFQEEVQLEGGELIKVDRFIIAKSLGEIGGPGGWEPEYMSLQIAGPEAAAQSAPKWESTAGLVPILLERDPAGGEWVLLATFYTCEAWYGLGRPKLPYTEFRLRDGRWQQMGLSAQWLGRAANLLTDIRSGGEPQIIRLAEKQERMSDSRIAPKYRFIVERWSTGC